MLQERNLIPTAKVYFDVKERQAGESKYTLKKMLTLACDGITSFSVVPLKLISLVGFTIFIISMLAGLDALYTALFTNDAVPGWASTVLPIYFVGGIELLSLGIIGEYIGKIYTETKHRPHYFIEEEIA
jgi:glycosyltransferase involved in cell wall biosynthesis